MGYYDNKDTFTKIKKKDSTELREKTGEIGKILLLVLKYLSLWWLAIFLLSVGAESIERVIAQTLRPESNSYSMDLFMMTVQEAAFFASALTILGIIISYVMYQCLRVIIEVYSK